MICKGGTALRWLSTYPREIKAFLVASLINSIGSSIMWPLITMFVYKQLGRTVADAGMVVMFMSLGGIIGQLIGGSLYHRIGVKVLIVGGLGLNALSLILVPFGSHNWVIFMVMMTLSGFFNAISMPAIQAFIGYRFKKQRSELFNIIYVANNIGVAVGTSLSGLLAFVSYELSFVLNGCTSLIFAIFFLVYLKQLDTDDAGVQRSQRTTIPNELSTWQLLMNYKFYLFMGLGSFLIWFGNSIWNNGVSPYTINQGMAEWNYSILWTLNGILIFAGQPITIWIKNVVAKTSGTQLIASAIFYLLGYAVILTFQDYPSMVVGMILTTFGEMLVLPAIPTFISERGGSQAPFYLGLVGGIGIGGKVLGPYAFGMLFDWNGLPPVAWVSLSSAILAVLVFAIHAFLHKGEEQQLASM